MPHSPGSPHGPREKLNMVRSLYAVTARVNWEQSLKGKGYTFPRLILRVICYLSHLWTHFEKFTSLKGSNSDKPDLGRTAGERGSN